MSKRQTRGCRSFVIGTPLFLLGLLPWSECRGQADSPDLTPRASVVCGPNALLMFLVLCGRDVPNELVDEIPCGANGASMLELCNICNSLGVDAAVRQYDVSEISQIGMPAIWQSRQAKRSHFFVVYNIDSRGVFALDGTTGQRHLIANDRIDSFFTGYALVAKRSSVGALAERFIYADILGWPLASLNAVLVAVLVASKIKGFSVTNGNSVSTGRDCVPLRQNGLGRSRQH